MRRMLVTTASFASDFKLCADLHGATLEMGRVGPGQRRHASIFVWLITHSPVRR